MTSQSNKAAAIVSHSTNDTPKATARNSRLNPLPFIPVQCLTPIEGKLSTDADLSARNVAHRPREVFEGIVAKSTVILKKKLSAPVAYSPLASLNAPSPLGSNIRGGSTTSSGQRSVSTQFMRGYALHRLEQYSQAAEDFLACSRTDPDRATAFYNRSCALYKLGKHGEAAQDLSKAIKLDPRNLLFIESRARVLKEMGKFEEAIRDYTRLDTIKHLPTTTVGSLPSELSPPASFETPISPMEKTELQGLNSVATSSTASMEQDAQKSSAKVWFEQFLNQDPGRRRSSTDVAQAAQLARSWSFFRGMRMATIERCLREATFSRFESNQVMVDQGKTSSSYHVVLDTVAPLVKTVTFQGSSSRELSTLYQGDTIGLEPFSAINTDGKLVTLRHRAQKQFMVRSRVGSTNVPLMSLASTRSINGFHPGSMGSFSTATQATRAARGVMRPKETATFSCLGEVNCMILDLDIYLIIMREHEQQLLAERLQFLRRCHAFQTCTDEMLAALVAVSGTKLVDPSKDVLKAGDVVKQLYVIKKGVCHVLKTIAVPHRSHASPLRPSSSKSDDSLTSRSNDGSWVLDNGWMLTNPRLVSNAQALAGEMLRRSEEVATAVLASGQLFGELSVLQPGQHSPVTVRTQTLVELLVFEEEDLSQLRVQYLSGTMNALQESLLFHNPPQQKLAQLRLDLTQWSREKRGVLEELFPPGSPVAKSPLKTTSTRGQLPPKTPIRAKTAQLPSGMSSPISSRPPTAPTGRPEDAQTTRKTSSGEVLPTQRSRVY